MDDQTLFNIMNGDGYHLLDKPHPHSPGHIGLLVAVRETPTGQHFDPETIALSLSDLNQDAGHIKLTLTSSLSAIQRLLPGQIVLHDRLDKRVYFFAYGGTLQASTRDGMTLYVIRSPAPILLMSDGIEGVPEQLAAETEALLAKIHAGWGLNDQGFSHRLARVEPLSLYAATIYSILSMYQKNPTLREHYHALYEVLRGEKKWLIQLGRRPTAVPDLETLLGDH